MDEMSDYEFAKRLQTELNSETNQENLDDSVVFVCEGTPSKFFLNSKKETSEDIKFISQTWNKSNNIQINDLIGQKFYSDELREEISLNDCADWAEVKMDKNIQFMFDKIQNFFFDKWLNNEKFIVRYDSNINSVINDDSSFKIFENENTIMLAKENMIRPRNEVIALMIHILIHFYLKKVSKGAIKLHHHDENFRKIMNYINLHIKMQISSSHKFVYSSHSNENHKHWWQCTGVCSNYTPFFGIIRSTIVPNESLSFWKKHHLKCDGTFFKIFEFKRMNNNGEIEIKYLRNVKYMNPTPNNNNDKSSNIKTNLPIREHIDLTSDNDSPLVQNLCEIIDLDDSQYGENSDVEINDKNCEHYNTFKQFKQFLVPLIGCCFCFDVFLASQLASHFDTCCGYQEKVQYVLHRR
ncbi:hypothetical protein PVAND_003671 [Polypedilum vanderplanki]|uniref:SprT-like domain-containing protein n=1 Tax=Polypedilum vanderplanki TaxID=319348 RepID=A0A9J6BVA2_POLVA|nr:hypothetical protein PVAND_003671 [Polypedilum vanderplanki]